MLREIAEIGNSFEATTIKGEQSMDEYKVGGLSDLFSKSSSGGADIIDELFQSNETNSTSPENSHQPLIENSPPEAKKQQKKKAAEKHEKKDEEEEEEDEVKYTQPSKKYKVRHEELNRQQPKNEETERRTVFVGNLPTDMTSKKLKRHFQPFGAIETIRFRGAARPDLKTTKKQAIIQKKFHEKRSSLIAYIRFTELESAQKSLKLNGSTLDDKVIRVDIAFKPAKEDSKVDQSRAVFVGNVPFDVTEDDVIAHFSKCGKIDNVRIVRDAKTGIGKGFCYVNFIKRNGVKIAVELMNGTTLSGRELRVNKSVERPKKTLKLVPDLKSKGGTFPHKKEHVAKITQQKTVVFKKKKADLKPSYEGYKAAKAQNSVKAKKKSKARGQMMTKKNKMIAKQFG